MHFKSNWSYINKGLLIILSFLVISTLASIIFLADTLLGLRTLTQKSGNAVGTVFVLQDLLINVQDVQTSVRGYVLTGDKFFIIPYNQARKDIPTDLKILETNADLQVSQE